MLGSWKVYLQARLFQITRLDLACTTAFESGLSWPCLLLCLPLLVHGQKPPWARWGNGQAQSPLHMHAHAPVVFAWVNFERGQSLGPACVRCLGQQPWQQTGEPALGGWCGCMFHPSNCGIVHSWFIRKQASCCGFSKNASSIVVFRAGSVFELWSWTAPEMAVWMV